MKLAILENWSTNTKVTVNPDKVGWSVKKSIDTNYESKESQELVLGGESQLVLGLTSYFGHMMDKQQQNVCFIEPEAVTSSGKRWSPKSDTPPGWLTSWE